MRYTYTNDDIEFLKEHYPNGEWNLIFSRFPTLTKSCIHKKCFKLGIKSNNLHRQSFNICDTRKRWTDEEIETLKNNYSKMSINDLCKLLPGRTNNMIATKAKTLHLSSYSRNIQLWKDDEIRYISDNWELTPDKIMATHLNRTFRAVKYKREELGFYRQNKDEKSYPTLSKYLRGQNQKWKNESMQSCNYRCVLTGSKNFEIHHLYGVSNIINEIFNKYPKYKDKHFDSLTEKDLSFLLEQFLLLQSKYPLGVCVNEKLHILFHSMYGQYYNTPEQWDRFCEDYKNGIYNKYI